MGHHLFHCVGYQLFTRWPPADQAPISLVEPSNHSPSHPVERPSHQSAAPSSLCWASDRYQLDPRCGQLLKVAAELKVSEQSHIRAGETSAGSSSFVGLIFSLTSWTFQDPDVHLSFLYLLIGSQLFMNIRASMREWVCCYYAVTVLCHVCSLFLCCCCSLIASMPAARVFVYCLLIC